MLGLENHILEVHNRDELALDRDRVIVPGALELVIDSHGQVAADLGWCAGCAPAHPICAARPEFVEISGVYLITGWQRAQGWPRLRSGVRQQRRDEVPRERRWRRRAREAEGAAGAGVGGGASYGAAAALGHSGGGVEEIF